MGRKIKYHKTFIKYPKLLRKFDLRFKLSIKEIKDINFLRKQGFTLQTLANKFNVSTLTILYHTNTEYRKKQMLKNAKRPGTINNKRRQKVRKIKGDKFREYNAIYKRNFIKKKIKKLKYNIKI